VTRPTDLVLTPVPDFVALAIVRGLLREQPKNHFMIAPAGRIEQGCSILGCTSRGEPLLPNDKAQARAYINGYASLWSGK
jgi:hypothetical protein